MVEGIRIIGGEGCGRYIKTFKNDLSVRPLLGRIKKSFFDIIARRITGARFLDLYAGTGAVGIEAVSRGAAEVVFVDGDIKCVRLIRENLENLGWSGRASVEQCDITRGLALIQSQFDIIYMGPPYKDAAKRPLSLTGTTLEKAVEADKLKSGGWIISQRHIKEPVAVPPALKAFREEKYGDTILVFYERSDNGAV